MSQHQLDGVNDMLRQTVDHMREGIQVLAPDWRYVYVNEAAARHGRKPREELVGKTLLECYPGMEKTEVFGVMERCMKERRAAQLETPFTFDSGETAWFELRVQPCEAGIVVLSLDVTDRKSVQRKVREEHDRTLRNMSTPVVRVHEGVLLLPLVGTLDTERAERLITTALERVADDHARVLILDVAGVPTMDTAVAGHLVQTSASVKLLGATTVLTGISADAARTLVHLGVDLSTMKTVRGLEEGIALAMELAKA